MWCIFEVDYATSGEVVVVGVVVEIEFEGASLYRVGVGVKVEFVTYSVVYVFHDCVV